LYRFNGLVSILYNDIVQQQHLYHKYIYLKFLQNDLSVTVF